MSTSLSITEPPALEAPTDRSSRLERIRRRYTPEQAQAMREQLKRACELANDDPETLEIMRELDALPDTMEDEWKGPFELPAPR